MADTSSTVRRSTQRELIRRLLSDGSVRRSSALLADGVQPSALADALRDGIVVRTAPGAYHLASSVEPSPLLAIATVCARAAGALVCLTTAAHLCGLLDDAPTTVWIARPVGARVPKKGATREQVVHWRDPAAFEVGVVPDLVCGVEIRRTDAARTVVDTFRYARYVGGDETSLRLATTFLRQGGSPGAIIAIAEQTGAPIRSMNAITAFLQAAGFPSPP